MFLSKGYKGIYYLYFNDPTTGKRKKISTRSKLKSEANKFMLTYKPKLIETPYISPIITLEDLQGEILKYVTTHYTTKTFLIYRAVLSNLILIIGNKALNLIKIQDIEDYKTNRLEKINKTSINIEIRTIKAIFNLAVKWNYLTGNPAKEVNQMIVNQKERLAFSDDEVNSILNIINEPKFKNLILFVLYTGVRLGEVVNIQHRDLNMIERTIIIRNKGNFKTKTGKIREIPISDQLMNILQDILGNNENVFPLYAQDDYLFTNSNGTRYEQGFISKKFKKYLRKAKLDEKYHFHCLRHTFLSKLAKNGVSLYQLKEIAGHSSIKTTELYLHTITSELRDAVNKMSLNLG